MRGEVNAAKQDNDQLIIMIFPLFQEIQKFLDDATNGAIFFSLGTNVRSDKMSKDKINAFLDAFSELDQRVLWKFESDSLPNLPGNVMVKKWLPQNDILGQYRLSL